LFDVLTQLGEASGGKFNFNNRKLRVLKFLTQLAEPI
jgi:hypothetical protein